jgi:hypothetical protein
LRSQPQSTVDATESGRGDTLAIVASPASATLAGTVATVTPRFFFGGSAGNGEGTTIGGDDADDDDDDDDDETDSSRERSLL